MLLDVVWMAVRLKTFGKNAAILAVERAHLRTLKFSVLSHLRRAGRNACGVRPKLPEGGNA
jgi:hypothetical protein